MADGACERVPGLGRECRRMGGIFDGAQGRQRRPRPQIPRPRPGRLRCAGVVARTRDVAAKRVCRECVAFRERKRRSVSCARPRGCRTIASRAGDQRTITLSYILPCLKLVIGCAPFINAWPTDVGTPAPATATSARARTLARDSAEPCRPHAPAPTPRMPAGPLYTALPRLRGVHAARRRELRPLRRARGPVRRPPDAARRHVHVRLRQQLHRALQTRLCRP